jgi:hypothetical protein
MLSLRTFAVVAFWVVLGCEAIAESRLLLMPGDSLPSSHPDATVRQVERLSSNRHGELFITADADSSSGRFGGIWRTDLLTGETVLVMEDGGLVPGVDNAVFDEPFSEDIGADVGLDGGIGIIASYSMPEPSASGFGTWYWDHSSGLTQLLLNDDPAPTFVDRMVSDPEIGSVSSTAGLVNIFADTVPSGTVGPKNDAAWMRDAAGEFHLAAVTGTPAPGLPDLVIDDEPWVNWINTRGQYLLEAGVNTPGGTPSESQRTVWLAEQGVDGPLARVLTQGDELPVDGGSAETFGTFNLHGLNNNGTVLLSSRYGGGSLRGVWTFETESGFRHIVSEGDPLPGLEPFRFEQVSAVDLSDDGEILIQNDHPDFHAHYGSGLWLGSSDENLHPVIMAGQAAPETETVFSDFGTTFRNANGQIAVEGSLENDTQFDPRDDEMGIWAQDVEDDFRLIVREGMSVGIGDEQFAIMALSLIGFDDFGHVVFGADLSDGAGEAVFVSDVVAVPEPSTMMYVVAAFLLLTGTGNKVCRSRQSAS